jgi:L-threonylcarbamoyladenylate synthase
MQSNSLSWSNNFHIKLLLESLRRDAIALGTSDTTWGLLAPLSYRGFSKLNSMKGRTDKPYIVLIRSLEQYSYFTASSQDARIYNLLNVCWPGPVTVVVKAHDRLAPYLISARGTIALRVPHHQGLQMLLEDVSGVFSTSANRAGCPVPDRLVHVDSVLLKQVDVIIQNDEYEQQTTPSTIIDLSGKKPCIVRSGSYPPELLESLLIG